MAKVLIADPLAEEILDAMRDSGMKTPLLTFTELRPIVENARGPKGESIWTKTSSERWYVQVLDWGLNPHYSPKDPCCVTISGVPCYVDEYVRAANGTFHVVLGDKGLRIECSDA